MNLYLDEFMQGINETLQLYKQGNNIFEMKGGNMFPTIDKQHMWQYARGPKHIHFTDGTSTYSFSGDLGEEDTELEKIPDVPLPDIFTNAEAKGKAQVHRADPGSIYFTLQEGTRNPTYTFRHTGDSKWRAIPKKKKVKEQLKEPAYIPNINAEQLKQGMVQELEEIIKQSGFLDSFNHAAGDAITGAIEGGKNLALAPGRIGGATNSGSNAFANAGKAALLGGGIGLGYHGVKRHFLNTPEENETEDSSTLLRRIALPALAMAGLNAGQRSIFGNPGGYYDQAAAGKTPNILG